MTLVACVECKAEISDSAKSCPQCGAKQPKSKKWLWVTLGVVGGVFALLLVVGQNPESQARGLQRHSIELCWEDQKRKVFDPATARFVAGVCEKMEADFVRAHGRKP